MKIKLTREELNWVERAADIETAQLFRSFNDILRVFKDADEKSKIMLNAQIEELIKLFTFLKTLRAKLEMWDCRYDIDTEINLQEKES